MQVLGESVNDTRRAVDGCARRTRSVGSAVEAASEQLLRENEIHHAVQRDGVGSEVAGEREEHPVHADVGLLH